MFWIFTDKQWSKIENTLAVDKHLRQEALRFCGRTDFLLLEEQVAGVLVDAGEFANRIRGQGEWLVASHDFKLELLLIKTGLCRIELDVEGL